MPERIAIFSDIHGNLPALEAVLDDLVGQNIDEILVGGDLVGRGPQGSAVVHRVRELGLESIGGNHEEYLLDFRTKNIPYDWRVSEEWAASRWMAAELDDSAAAWITGLPFSIERPDFSLVHGTPVSNRQGIGPWTNDDVVCDFLDMVGENILICAHTHRQMVREIESGLVINTGSVGLPFDHDPRAQYLVLTRGGEWGWRPELRRVEYDLSKIFKVYEETGFLYQGGVTAELLRVELEHASPVLVPFLEWSRVRCVEPSLDELPEFFKFHDPDASLRDFFERLRRLVEQPQPPEE